MTRSEMVLEMFVYFTFDQLTDDEDRDGTRNVCLLYIRPADWWRGQRWYSKCLFTLPSTSWLMTRTEMVLETLVYLPFDHLTRLLARDYFIEWKDNFLHLGDGATSEQSMRRPRVCRIEQSSKHHRRCKKMTLYVLTIQRTNSLINTTFLHIATPPRPLLSCGTNSPTVWDVSLLSSHACTCLVHSVSCDRVKERRNLCDEYRNHNVSN